ncbi:VOC family protein [Sphingomonas glacialis]|nr:VOC family protein [Sphingomonas glacialis]
MRTALVIGLGLHLIASGAPARAQRIDPAPALALDHVGIQAADLVRSARFYGDVLGLKEASTPFPIGAARWFALGGGRMLHIVANVTVGAPHNRWDHFALACADLDAMIARLDARHIPWADMDGHRSAQRRPDNVRQIFVRDPDGYVIEINDAKA